MDHDDKDASLIVIILLIIMTAKKKLITWTRCTRMVLATGSAP